jgi:membrane-bound acyltransferase YfiQ involved in biofilm formation
VILFGFSAVYWLAHAYYFHLGVWWYNTIFCFPIGVYIGNNYQIFVGHISKLVQKNYLLLMFGTTGLFLLSYLIANTPLGSMLRMGIVYQTASSILFLFFIMSILLKIQLTSNMMGFLGGISYEMYLVHVQVLNIYFKTYNGNNIYTYFVLVIATSILLKEVVKLIQNLFWQSRVKWRYGN